MSIQTKTPEQLRAEARHLRVVAAQMRAAAQFAESHTYRREIGEAARLEQEAAQLEYAAEDLATDGFCKDDNREHRDD